MGRSVHQHPLSEYSSSLEPKYNMRLSIVPLLAVIGTTSALTGWTGLDWTSFNTWGTYFLPAQGVVKVWAAETTTGSTATTPTATSAGSTASPATTSSTATTTTQFWTTDKDTRLLTCPAQLIPHPIKHVCRCEKRILSTITTTTTTTTTTTATTTTTITTSDPSKTSPSPTDPSKTSPS